jgi:hypothetical protein
MAGSPAQRILLEKRGGWGGKQEGRVGYSYATLVVAIPKFVWLACGWYWLQAVFDN